MLIELTRYSSQKYDTLGLLFIDSEFIAYTIEDEYRTKKVFGETRIPEGEYQIDLRAEGGFHNRYLDKYGSNFHKGMLCIHNAKDWKIVTCSMEFQYCLFHIGNKEKDTAGCVLVGNQSTQNLTTGGSIGNSASAYKRFYPIVRDSLLKGEKVKFRITDYENKINI